MSEVIIPITPVQEMDREALVAEIMWGHTPMWGHGVPVAEVYGQEWPSIVLVGGPPSKYSDDDLRKIVEFSREQTAIYDRMFSFRRGAILYLINLADRDYAGGRWMRKRDVWNHGPFFSQTLDEALEFMRR